MQQESRWIVEVGDLVLSRAVRRNHALEHATVTLLARRIPALNVSARSSARGFTIFADLDADLVRACADEALARLRDGETWLAIHPNCGTNLAVGTSFAVAGSMWGFLSPRARTRILSLMLSTVAGIAVARPLGYTAQRLFTTSTDVEHVRIIDVRRKRFARKHVVEVLTQARA